MKRWQDRGEVQDSDDEDEDFSNESQSPEHARKRPRLETDQTEDHIEHHTVSPAVSAPVASKGAAEEPWLHAKPATTYGRRTTRATLKQPTATPPDTEVDHELIRPNVRRSTAVCVAIPAISAPEVRQRVASDPRSSQTDESEELASLSQLLAYKPHGRPVTPDAGLLHASSAASSPLSELEDSPGPAPIFHLSAEASTSQDAINAIDRDSIDETQAVIAGLLEGNESALGGRRNFRTRTEKQLHPYLHDKTLYQQQWRQRGLRPVHFNVADKQATETQDRSFSGDESDSQEQQPGRSSSPVRTSSELGEEFDAFGRSDGYHGAATTTNTEQPVSVGSDDEFPDIDTILQRKVPGAVQNGRKRRKLDHQRKSNDDGKRRRPDDLPDLVADEYSVPISPPPTSSDSARQVPRLTLPSGFRLPFGATPAPLPTPQVSSDVRPARATTVRSDSESPPCRSRTSTVSRVLPRSTVVDSSTESEADSAEESEPDARVVEKQLRRQRKRMKGVLPASWLKIDLKAQQRRPSSSPSRSPSPFKRLGEASPPPSTRPLKGVAQRVARAATTPARVTPWLMSDDEAGTDDESFGRGDQSFANPAPTSHLSVLRDDVDDDGMEIDWIDPMLASSSRRPKKSQKERKRQPGITDAFQQSGNNYRMDLSEERRGLQYVTGNKGASRPVKAPKQRKRHGIVNQTARPPAPRLSVLDAPNPTMDSGQTVPHFVRLAKRQARHQARRGRHSPSRKVIRLATDNDTEEAAAVLRAWREGTIAPKASPEQIQDIPPVDVSAPGSDEETSPRLPLADVTNLQQQTLPVPLRKQARIHRPSRQPTGRQQRQPGQTRLQPIVLRTAGQPSSSALGTEEAQPATAPRPSRLTVRAAREHVTYRGGQLESLETSFNQEHRGAAFERRMACLTEAIAIPRRSAPGKPLQLERFMNVENDASSPIRRPATARGEIAEPHEQSRQQQPARTSLPYRRRKRQPQRIDIDIRQYRQPSEPLPDFTVVDEPPAQLAEATGPVLRGLGQFGTRYATDFDIQPLPLGTYFYQSTFIGSGDFAASMKLTERDLGVMTGRMRVHVAGDVLEWGAWTEEVAVCMARIPQAISDALRMLPGPPAGTTPYDEFNVVAANVEHMLRSIVRYCSSCLTFLDRVDRRLCIQRLHAVVGDLLEVDFQGLTSPNTKRLQINSLQYALVIAMQAVQLSSDQIIPIDMRERSQALSARAAQTLAQHASSDMCSALRTLYEDMRRTSRREAGIGADDTVISSVLILKYCLQAGSSQLSLWKVLDQALQFNIGGKDSVAALDSVWYDLFSVLPALEVDAAGIAQPGSRLRDTTHDWCVPKALVARLFELYAATSTVRGSTINDYVRATFARCYTLVSRWGWWKCEKILGTVFDFFARRNLAPLHHEQSRGSPAYLGALEYHASLEIQPEDRSFHVFLKMLAVGLQSMQKHGVYSDKKVGGIAWRFIPNHGRTYPKDANVKQEDIDALRNHYDLLCTLYYASPPSHRLRVELLQNLVDHSSSHREACRLSVRAWANITSFQASTGESVDKLLPLTSWFREMLHATMVQFRLARTEAERDFAAAKAQAAGPIPDALLISTIAANQRQIAGTLVDCLAGLKRALHAASSPSAVSALLEGCVFLTAFVPFDAAEKRLVPALDEALEVVKVALDVSRKLASTVESQTVSDDSQDYGDLSALQEFAASEGAKLPQAQLPHTRHLLHEPLAQLLSNAFGADISLDDSILSKLLDVWARVAKEAVRSGDRGWNSFLNGYNADAWHQLRDTAQTRKFTPYLLARVIDEAGGEDAELTDSSLISLLVSLVEREALLKHQHMLLTALMINATDEPLLENLPFTKDKQHGRYAVSLHDLRQRRLAVLSSILSNMRRHFDDTLYGQPRKLQLGRRRLTEMLRAVMQAMKSNYQELQGSTSDQSADPNVSGAYVDFVQHVVGYLQQHTTDICRIDPFFTDSFAFPLPATDPTYVVGRLRSYVPKLAESKTRKQLAVFVHTVSERAAVDGHQEYLVEQLCTAMDGVLERGDSRAPSLRHMLLTAVFPCYIKAALSTACSWILALPLLRVSATVLGNMLYHVDTSAGDSTNATVGMLTITVASLDAPLREALAHPGLLRLPHVQEVLTLVVDTAARLLTVSNYLKRLDRTPSDIVNGLINLRQGVQEVRTQLTDASGDIYEHTSRAMTIPSQRWPDTQIFAEKQLQDAVTNDWHAYDGQYFVRRGNKSREVVMQLGDEDEQQGRLLAATEGFSESFDTVMNGGQARIRRGRAAASGAGGLDGVMI